MKIIKAKEAAQLVKDGDSVMVGGFLSCGGAIKTLNELAKLGTKNLTIISNDTAYPEVAQGQLVVNKQVKKAIATHVGTNKETGRQLGTGELEVEFVPQGTLAERIRAKGAGIGGILVRTGLGTGTNVDQGKEIIKVDGVEYLLERPLGANIALLYATIADKYGNLYYDGTTKNFNAVMATAADIVVVEVEQMVDELDPNTISVPGLMVDYIVESTKE